MKKITFLILILLLPPVSFSADEVGNCGMSTVYMRPYSKKECDQIKKEKAQRRKKSAFEDSIRPLRDDIREVKQKNRKLFEKKYGLFGRYQKNNENYTRLKEKFEKTFGKHERYLGSKRDRENKTGILMEGYGASHQDYGLLYYQLAYWYEMNAQYVFGYMVNYKKGHKNVEKYINWFNQHPFDPVLWTDLCYEELKEYADTGKATKNQGRCNPKGGKEVDYKSVKRFIYTYGEDL